MNRDFPSLSLQDEIREDEIGYCQALLCTLRRHNAPELEVRVVLDRFHSLIAARTPEAISVQEITRGLV